VLLARIVEATADPPPAWLPPVTSESPEPHAILFFAILELIVMHGGTPERLELALPPLAVALGAAAPETANAAARIFVRMVQSAATPLPGGGGWQMDAPIARAIVDWGLLPLVCDRARDVARAGDAEERYETAHFAAGALVCLLTCVPTLAGAAAAAGAVAAMAAAVTCDASAAAAAPELQKYGAQLAGLLLGPDGGLDRFGVPAGIDPDAIVCAPGVLQALASCSSTDCWAQKAAKKRWCGCGGWWTRTGRGGYVPPACASTHRRTGNSSKRR
jgi:hypothetical protein